MKRMNPIFVVLIVLLLGVGVFAQSSSMSQNSEDFVKNVVAQKGVDEEKIKSVEEVDMNALPEEVNIKNIDETNLAMYKVDVEGENPVYIITASDEKFKEEVANFANKVLLSFGMAGDVENSVFLNSATGVTTSRKNGYVMMRDGSITGISTNLNVEESLNGGAVEILLYKNGEAIGFRNTIRTDSEGSKVDYDTIAEDTLNFEKGDIISAEVVLSDGTRVTDVNTLLEINYRE